MAVVYLIIHGAAFIARHSTTPNPWWPHSASDCFWIVPGTLDPDED